MDWPTLLILLAPMALIYLAPTVVALQRGHPNKVPIAIINLLLGWTFVGWVAALAWSATAFRR